MNDTKKVIFLKCKNCNSIFSTIKKNKKYCNSNCRNFFDIYKNSSRRKYQDEWHKTKRKIQPFYRLYLNSAKRFNNSLKKNNYKKKYNCYESVIGCSKEEFKRFLEKKFKKNMTWDNYGHWHLDHIKPLCSAENEEEFYILNHYSNFQPLWAYDNLLKGGNLK